MYTIRFFRQVDFQSSWVSYSTIRIIDKTKQLLAIWVLFVIGNINDKLLSYHLIVQTLTGHFYLNNYFLYFCYRFRGTLASYFTLDSYYYLYPSPTKQTLSLLQILKAHDMTNVGVSY